MGGRQRERPRHRRVALCLLADPAPLRRLLLRFLLPLFCHSRYHYLVVCPFWYIAFYRAENRALCDAGDELCALPLLAQFSRPLWAALLPSTSLLVLRRPEGQFCQDSNIFERFPRWLYYAVFLPPLRRYGGALSVVEVVDLGLAPVLLAADVVLRRKIRERW